MQQERILILSDGKPGHLNQAIAFAKHLHYQYDVCSVRFNNRLCKAVSYLADRLRVRLHWLFKAGPISGKYKAVVSAGSETYYANRVLAAALGIKSVAIMLPKGYRYDFDLIIAQQHDDPPVRDNIISLPINLTYVEPQGLVVPAERAKYVSLIIGGDSKQGRLDSQLLSEQITQVFNLFPQHRFWLTTSRRTPAEIEAVLRKFEFERAVYYSQEQINPIPDFLQHSDYVFLTADSTSMISEAVSYGRSCVEVLPPADNMLNRGKFNSMLKLLQHAESLHLFDGQLGAKRHKIDLVSVLNAVRF